MSTVIHLVRHATYDLLDRGILAGRTQGWGLNEAGRMQAARLGQALAERPLAAVVASPLERAQETAKAIAHAQSRGDGQGCEVETDAAFHEVEFGAWSNRPFAALRDDPAWVGFNRFRSTAAPPGGESMLQVQARAVAGLEALVARFPDAELAVVTHADVVKAVLVHLLGMPLDLFQRLEIAPASRSPIVLGADFAKVLAVNLPA